ncbi:hypothetical protein [Henriciella aquimarina]|uniref:hypothetical protein n=1 Tax=Henriciella aquimarina TaxID=545261 RepID=UPI0009FFA6B0|nr:hypothetical protein [Henriciella aquimarina]
MTEDERPTPVKLDAQARKAQKRRNLWLALALFAFVFLVGITTAIRLGDADLGSDGGLYWRNDPQSDSQPMPELPSDQESPEGEAS